MGFHLLFVSLILFHTFHTSSPADAHWNYGDEGPDVWSDNYSQCQGTFQSPINIKTACTIYQNYSSFQFSSGYSATQTFSLTNNGHSIAGTQVDKTTNTLTVTGGGLSETFTFANFHLHWGENYKSGSEHQLNSQKYGGEIHFVHANAAQTQYAVLGFFMEVSKSSTHKRKKRADTTSTATKSEWEKYITVAKNLNTTNSVAQGSFSLSALMGSNFDKFYRYAGSLTTPPCSENVIWTIFQTPIQFTDEEIEQLRHNLFIEDYRDPQLLYARTVQRNFQSDIVSSAADNNACPPLISRTISSTSGISVSFMNKQFITFFCFFILFFYKWIS